MVDLVLVLGDQLSTGLASLAQADPTRDVVVMAEVWDEASYVPHHPKKIALIFAAMRKFAARLRHKGWTVAYSYLQDGYKSIPEVLLAQADRYGAARVIATEPGEWRLIEALQACPIPVTLLEDDRFLASHADFARWAEGRKQLRMEYFYRDMRRKTGLLMGADGKPEGGKWNYDHDNRKPASDDLFRQGPLRHPPDHVTQEVIDLVKARFGGNFGSLDDFWFATDADQAAQVARHFVDQLLPNFGDYQDAMLQGDGFLYHSLVSAYINIGLIDPLWMCQQVEQAYQRGHAPLNAAEGYIRQIIGWREYMRGIYFLEGPEYTRRNVLGHDRDLPAFYWSGQTAMTCVSAVVTQTRDEAYAHHIQRLMVTGNFALLAGVDPFQVHEWYLAVYTDAFEWVEAPNVIGMSQFADGGIVGSKPYVSSGAYINRMSDYCKSCSYSVTKKVGQGACPFNLLYWHFLSRHRDSFAKNPRMAQMYRTWDRMADDHKEAVLREAEQFLDAL